MSLFAAEHRTGMRVHIHSQAMEMVGALWHLKLLGFKLIKEDVPMSMNQWINVYGGIGPNKDRDRYKPGNDAVQTYEGGTAYEKNLFEKINYSQRKRTEL